MGLCHVGHQSTQTTTRRFLIVDQAISCTAFNTSVGLVIMDKNLQDDHLVRESSTTDPHSQLTRDNLAGQYHRTIYSIRCLQGNFTWQLGSVDCALAGEDNLHMISRVTSGHPLFTARNGTSRLIGCCRLIAMCWWLSRMHHLQF